MIPQMHILSDTACRVCANSKANRLYQAKEMMFETGETFDYLECALCGTLQILRVPDDLSRYYPKTYAAHAPRHGLRSFLSKRAAFFQWNGYCFLGMAQVFLAGRNIALDAIKHISANTTQKLLEIGCGSGDLLRHLHYLGFRSLHGIDPFISPQAVQDTPFSIRKETLKDVQGSFDLIVLNHVFEHMPDPAETLKKIEQRLNTNGTALILIPVAGCMVWKEYLTHWVQLDAPRHLFLHTRKGMEILCQQAGLMIHDVLWNSTEFQIVGSQEYQKGIPLTSKHSIYAPGIRNRIRLFIAKIVLRSKVAELNAKGQGDQACFILKKKRE